MNQRLLVIGAGAIGSFVGATLALAGQPVTLVARPNTAAHIRAHGLRLRQGEHVAIADQVDIVPSLADAFGRPDSYGLAVLAVKSYDTAQAAAELRAAVTDPPPILTLQNGVGNEEIVANAVGSPVIAGAITTPVAVLEPGCVVLERSSRRLGLANVNGASSPRATSTPSAATLAEVFAAAGFQVRCYDDWRSLKWTKLVMNLLCNATCALLDWPPEQVWADRELVALELAAWREAMAVMSAQGLDLVNLGGYPLAQLEPLLRSLPASLLAGPMRRFVIGGRGGKLPSLHLDLSQGKGRSEVEWLNGAVVKAGRQTGMPTPANQLLLDSLLAVMRGEEPWATYRRQPGALIDKWRSPTSRPARPPLGSGS